MLIRKLREEAPEAVLAGNLAIGSAAPLAKACRAAGIPYIHWLQDIYGTAAQVILKRRLGTAGLFAGTLMTAAEKRVWRTSAGVISICDDFLHDLTAAGVDPAHVITIPNWAPIEELPLASKDNRWAAKHGLTDKFVFLYSGTLGLKHSPGHLLALAQHFNGNSRVRIAVCSQGLGADLLKEQITSLGLTNLLVLPFQNYEDMPSVFASADVLTVLLEKEAGRYSVPSKTLSYMCAAKPILASTPSDNLVSRLISTHQMGIVTDPDNPTAFVGAAEAMAQQPDRLKLQGSNARRYAENNFPIALVAPRFQEFILKAIQVATKSRAGRLI